MENKTLDIGKFDPKKSTYAQLIYLDSQKNRNAVLDYGFSCPKGRSEKEDKVGLLLDMIFRALCGSNAYEEGAYKNGYFHKMENIEFYYTVLRKKDIDIENIDDKSQLIDEMILNIEKDFVMVLNEEWKVKDISTHFDNKNLKTLDIWLSSLLSFLNKNTAYNDKFVKDLEEFKPNIIRPYSLDKLYSNKLEFRAFGNKNPSNLLKYCESRLKNIEEEERKQMLMNFKRMYMEKYFPLEDILDKNYFQSSKDIERFLIEKKEAHSKIYKLSREYLNYCFSKIVEANNNMTIQNKTLEENRSIKEIQNKILESVKA